jgi:molecular chaperone GrpE
MQDNATPADTTEAADVRDDVTAGATEGSEETVDSLRAERDEYKEKYLRLYAEFDNYRKKVQKDKDELIKYSNESMAYELLPVLDSMDMALKHTAGGSAETVQSLRQGVDNTFRELNRTLEKFGLSSIETNGVRFDPSYHHAMSRVERDDIEDNLIVEELRKGYKFNDKVLRPTFVTVSVKPSDKLNPGETPEQEIK